jgi:spore protease
MNLQENLSRTDLAIEEQERCKADAGALKGVRVSEHLEKSSGIRIQIVTISTPEGAAALGKPIGTYITLSEGTISAHSDEAVQASSAVMGHALNRLLPKDWHSLLVIGLGNANMTADALGPATTNQLLVNRHLNLHHNHTLAALTPGVMGQTGVETLEIVRGLLSQIHPDALLVIDALAARSTARLLSTIQLSDSGICPGSGVGNHRMELSNHTLGLPVISIGVPTVIGAATIVHDLLSDCGVPLPEDALRSLKSLYVTPKDIDVHIKELSTLLAEGIHHVVYDE